MSEPEDVVEKLTYCTLDFGQGGVDLPGPAFVVAVVAFVVAVANCIKMSHVQGAALVVTWSCLTPWWPGAGTPRARCAWPPSHQLRPPGHRAPVSPGHLHTPNIS